MGRILILKALLLYRPFKARLTQRQRRIKWFEFKAPCQEREMKVNGDAWWPNAIKQKSYDFRKFNVCLVYLWNFMNTSILFQSRII